MFAFAPDSRPLGLGYLNVVNLCQDEAHVELSIFAKPESLLEVLVSHAAP